MFISMIITDQLAEEYFFEGNRLIFEDLHCNSDPDLSLATTKLIIIPQRNPNQDGQMGQFPCVQ